MFDSYDNITHIDGMDNGASEPDKFDRNRYEKERSLYNDIVGSNIDNSIKERFLRKLGDINKSHSEAVYELNNCLMELSNAKNAIYRMSLELYGQNHKDILNN